jgi:predicted ATPase
MLEYKIVNLQFSGGETIEVEENSLLILIGPNNCGKSQALKEIHTSISSTDGRHKFKIVKETVTSSIQSPGKLIAWLDKFYPSQNIDTNDKGWSFFNQRGGGTTLKESQIPTTAFSSNQMSNLMLFLAHNLDTESRLTLSRPVASINVSLEEPRSYIHILQRNEKREKQVSDEVRAAFGKDLIINRGGGQQVGFHIGDDPPRSPGQDRVSIAYLNALNQLPKLEDEGDGIRSYVGCLLAVRCGAHKVLLIDEPEAFLHPPQARRIGRILADSAKDLNRQIIIATHSSDVIRGAMASSGKVAVCRIDRIGDKNHAHILSSNELKDLWAKPLLKSSGAVAGVFHKGVIVCEADSDCRFYESLLLRLEINNQLGQPADFHFVHGGGKGELATLAQSYKKLKIPMAVIADFDMLRKEGELEKLINVLGGDFAAIKREYISTISALAQIKPIKSAKDFICEMRAVLDSIQKDVTSEHRKEISVLLSDSRDWSAAKRYGREAFSGGKNQDCEFVLSELKKLGLFLVRRGEMESWDRSLSADKNKWILVLQRDFDRASICPL